MLEIGRRKAGEGYVLNSKVRVKLRCTWLSQIMRARPVALIQCFRVAATGQHKLSQRSQSADIGRGMVSAHDVAKYILQQQGEMSVMKLQKLVYYSQAWHLVWEDKPLFAERIRAWANGPVVRELYDTHKGRFMVSAAEWPTGEPANLGDKEKEAIDAVLKFYGDKPAAWLSELTHSEPPWKEARNGLAPGQRGDSEISTASMAEYYGSLV
jgi:uncharacterized phage-associated protein